jgi:hypothetical protein
VLLVKGNEDLRLDGMDERLMQRSARRRPAQQQLAARDCDWHAALPLLAAAAAGAPLLQCNNIGEKGAVAELILVMSSIGGKDARELIDLLPGYRGIRCLLPGGRKLMAAYLLPRAETAMCQELLQSRCSGCPTPPRKRAAGNARSRAARARSDCR